jgi:hypothetical protein
VNAQQSGLSGGEGGRKGGKAGRREGRREGKRTTMLPGGAQTDDECPLLDSSPLPLPPLVTSPPVGAVLTCRDPAFGEEGMHLVVVEGGPRSVRRFVKLMTRRIKWRAQQEGGGGQEGEGEEEEEEEEEEEDGGEDLGKGGGGICELVWRGVVAKPSFAGFKFQVGRKGERRRRGRTQDSRKEGAEGGKSGGC